MMTEIKKVGVLGAGLMGSGIAEIAAKAGYQTVYVARSAEKIAAVRSALERSLTKGVQRGKLTEEAMAEAVATPGLGMYTP